MKRRAPRKVEYGGTQHRIARPKGTRAPVVLSPRHPAIREARPLFDNAVHAGESPRVLIAGFNQRKIGAKVTKGRWAGMPIYTLTLEERRTCPPACTEWRNCYGNNMPFSRRHKLDEELMVCLMVELHEKARLHPEGFVVRAHVLGDFGSPDQLDMALMYVDTWALAFEEIPALRMWSYTAHDPAGDIGEAIMALNTEFPDRCRVRFSGRDMGKYGAVVVANASASRHVVCPVELGKTDCCATCALCWGMEQTVEFIRH